MSRAILSHLASLVPDRTGNWLRRGAGIVRQSIAYPRHGATSETLSSIVAPQIELRCDGGFGESDFGRRLSSDNSGHGPDDRSVGAASRTPARSSSTDAGRPR